MLRVRELGVWVQVADKYLIALDQSSQVTGYAIFKNQELISHGAVNFSGDMDKRLLKLRTWVKGKLDEYPGAQVAIEDIQLQNLGRGDIGVTTYKKLAWVQGALISLFAELKVPYQIVAPATWRNLCGIKGTARDIQKKGAQKRVSAIYSIIATEDEADAICLGDAVIQRDWSN